jgi:hypothetical protein
MQTKKNEIIKKISMEIKKLVNKDRIIKGSLYSVVRKRKNKDGLEMNYKGYQLTYKAEKNQTKTVYVKDKQVKKVNKLISDYHLVKEIINIIIQLNIELLKLEQRLDNEK